ncbi:Cys-tRNA(Pro) deacylase [Staphylococcus schleiferi]|uniref:Cys-tRNA(Pro) deacylase n=1 Tax=Staphylococcus schleiferi TaxID=1295 RepID=UPI00188886C8|nr:Cys-tRNA(Pro) deacylase [Staphylococcus schleiferi]MBF1993128.1 Cys-tRNA(Pro) deacylase [Staphylococcus schleiferi]MBF2038600.1 Cys-tRNA(Pro) deacylase [Staphylococcus schleiferi]MBF2100497.1 Cys-tRNA(Pro) deacylase [Staphylococcus schleiferi]MBF2102860.1 Cys-tRNA(Pro) deacylase [Staphylococcus schleiferi]MBF2104881.1 Cys-tRNA(Pro) deacylase [Staphylococcus schleiferi]
MAKQKKTNAMRMLDQAKVEYEIRTFPVSDAHIEGHEVAALIQAETDTVYKILVLENDDHAHFVFVIPVNAHLDMKAAAAAVNEKKLHLIPLDDLKKVTGYIRGGCSPIGMKTHFPTTIHTAVLACETVFVSAGQRGVQMGIAPEDLIRMSQAQTVDVIQ